MVILLTVLAALVYPVIYTEYTTKNHFDGFSEYMNSDISLITAQDLKILKYSDNIAKVYYFTPNGHGDVLYFTKTDGGWVNDSWDTYCSVSGNADRIVWPYWWHCVYYLFQ